MYTNLPTLGAPIMIVGLLAGFFLCFYGNHAKKYLIPLRSTISGAMVSLAVSLLLLQRNEIVGILNSSWSLQSLVDLLINKETYPYSIIYLLAISVGALVLFYLSRKPGVFLGKIVALFTGLSMALFIFLLLLGFLPFTLSLLFSAIVLAVILFFCFRDFPSYLAVENSIAGALLISYLLSRFWYLKLWIFLSWAAILTVAGILSQLRSLNRHKQKREKLDA
ncbi:hypothetical protein [Sphaerochaeta sp. PS]|uniref:hypothetical protein n=1 Tax=Sphaerochaeta sp. PS TaxID=3076336 RepID=UPI0028A40B0E|nr:hypothetical protein [Sphaerochaeta sp. PS]MDT4762046.1 hypothetical protein [Sphaerochaeta sp. PS]